MHILAAIIILAGFLGNIYTHTETPEGTILLPGSEPVPAMSAKITPLDATASHGITKQGYDYSCGSAALSTLLNGQFGEDFTEKQVIQGLLEYGDAELISKRRAFSLLDMKRFVKKLGYRGNGYKASIKDLKELQQPGILPIKIFNYRHFVVFKGVHKNHVFLADPWRGNISFDMNEFEEKWYEHVIFLISEGKENAWNRLRLSETDLRFIDEDSLKSLMSQPMWQHEAPLDRHIHNGSGPMDVYKR